MELTIIKEELIKALKIVAGFASKKPVHPVLTTVNVVNEDGQLYFYATNQFIACKYHIKNCTFSNLTSFKIDPYFILNLLKLYNTGLFTNVTIHTKTTENVYFIDIGSTQNIPLPRVIEDKYPNLNPLFRFDSLKEDLVLAFKINDLITSLQQLRAAGNDRIKLIRCEDNKNIMILGDNNLHLETIINPALRF